MRNGQSALARNGQSALARNGLTANARTFTTSGMSDAPPDSLIPYDEIVQNALRAVVGSVLGDVAKQGLPGVHHFYITFRTQAPGVSIPQRLIARFPDEMTIVIQNKFWDLKVDDSGFEIGLTFSQVPAHLRIPFDAVTAFVDPAVNFALHFQAMAEDQGAAEHEPAENDLPAPVTDGSNVVAVDFGKRK